MKNLSGALVYNLLGSFVCICTYFIILFYINETLFYYHQVSLTGGYTPLNSSVSSRFVWLGPGCLRKTLKEVTAVTPMFVLLWGQRGNATKSELTGCSMELWSSQESEAVFDFLDAPWARVESRS